MKNKRWIILVASLLVVGWFSYTPARTALELPWDWGTRLINALTKLPQTITAPWKFLGGSASAPPIALDADGNTGIYEISSGTIGLSSNGSGLWRASGSHFGGTGTGRGSIFNQNATATLPTFVFQDDSSSGMGSAGISQVDIIGNNLDILRADGTASSGASVWTDGGIVIGDISGATVSPITGSTAYVLIISGVSPAGGSGGSPVNAIQLYATGNELFVADGNGTHTGLGSFNVQTGMAESKKWNIYTGKIVTRNWETGAVIVDSGTTHDWKVDQIAYQKKQFIHSYTKQKIEVPEGQATEFGDIEIEDKLWWVVKYRFVRGKKVEYNDYAKKKVKSKEKTFKPDHWMDKDGKFWRKRTRPEAIAAYVVDMTPIRAKWLALPPFLMAEIPDPGE